MPIGRMCVCVYVRMSVCVRGSVSVRVRLNESHCVCKCFSTLMTISTAADLKLFVFDVYYYGGLLVILYHHQ